MAQPFDPLLPALQAARPRRVVVVGGGILGLATAWALARRGHAVTLLEAAPALPAVGGSSNDEGRIIRHAYGTMAGYASLMPAAFAAWRALFAATGQDRLVPMRAVYALRDDGPWAAAVAATQAAAGLGFRELDELELTALPMLGREGLRRAVEIEGSGILLARPILLDLVALLPRLGVDLRCGAKVVRIAPGQVTLADGARLCTEVVIAAAGPALPQLLPEAAAEAGLRVSLQSLAYLEPPADLAAAWRAAPLLLCRLPGQAAGGVYVLPPRAGTRLKIGDYATDTPGEAWRDDPAHPPHATRCAALLEAGAQAIADFARYRVLEQRHSLYTMAPEDRFVLRPAMEGVWLASACSGHGFKLAPLMALGLAAGLEERIAPEALAGWAAGHEGGASANVT